MLNVTELNSLEIVTGLTTEMRALLALANARMDYKNHSLGEEHTVTLWLFTKTGEPITSAPVKYELRNNLQLVADLLRGMRGYVDLAKEVDGHGT
jgi:hypothetical protein